VSARTGRWLDRLLPVWFGAWTVWRIIGLSWTGIGWDWSFIGRDFRIYRAAGEAVLRGADPWAASARWNGTDWHFAAPPTAAQLFVPFAVLPDGLGLVLFAGLSIGLAWLALRQLGLPAWWLLFPPMTEGIFAANPQVALFGLIVLVGAGRIATPVARATAVGLKPYALASVVARREWRAIGACAVLLAVSVLAGLGLWGHYLANAGSISARLIEESQGGASAAQFLWPGASGSAAAQGPVAVIPWLFLGVAGLLVLVAAIRDVTAAGWIAVPLLFPAAEYHLATMAIPAARRLSTWIIAVPLIPTYLLGLLILCWEVAAGRPALARTAPAVPLVRWFATLVRRDTGDERHPVAPRPAPAAVPD
jgi:hypothetical protein